MALNSIVLLFTFAVNLSLSLFIYFKNPRDEIYRSFGGLLFWTAFWTFSFLLFMTIRSPAWVVFLRRLTPVGSAILISYFLYFSMVFPSRRTPLRVWQRLLILLPGYLFAFFSLFTPYMIKDFMVGDFRYTFLGKPVFGPAYLPYALFLVAFFIFGVSNLVYKFLKAEGKEKLQIWYVLFGIGLTGSAGILTSLLLPLLGISRFFVLGPPLL